MKNLIFPLLVCLLISEAFASKALETNSISEVYEKVQELNHKYGSDKVLVVFDIDNTILAAKSELGSDQWFSWQEKLLFSKSKDPKLISRDFSELLKAQGLLFYAEGMRRPEGKLTSQTIRKIQGAKNFVFALTSRGRQFAYQTIRELLENNIRFETAPKFIKRFYLPQTAFNPSSVFKEYGFKKKDKKRFKLGKSREVQYLDGVFYTSGLHKGVMLKIFIKEANLFPKAIVFMDDKKKHTERVQDVFKDSGINVVTYRYGREDSRVKAFNKSTKATVSKEWKKMQEYIR